MRCWTLMAFVIVEPVEDKVSFWDHQTPGWNHLSGSNGGSLCTWSTCTWHTCKRRKRGHERQVDSGDTWTVSDVLWCIRITMQYFLLYVRPNSDLGALFISCDIVAISHASSWFMSHVGAGQPKSTRDRSDIHTRYKVVLRSLRGLTDAKICFNAVQTRHQTSQTAQVVLRWSPGAI